MNLKSLDDLDTNLEDLEQETKDSTVFNRLYKSLEQQGVLQWCDDQFKDRLEGCISRLHDEGVEFGDFIGSSRRVVFSGKLEGSHVVIKVSSMKADKKQQVQEEAIWRKAVEEGDDEYFAEIFLSDPSGSWIIQEQCYDVKWYQSSEDVDSLPVAIQEISDKYAISEIQVGTSKDERLKLVDYGH